jgi:hypothetical protein
MLFTLDSKELASTIFLPALSAGAALLVRAALYIYVFYIQDGRKIGVLDWLFALSHVVAALLLVITVIFATIFLFTQNPTANLEFIPYFIPGLVVVIVISLVPLVRMYRTR